MLLFSKIYEFYCLYGIEILLSGATGAAHQNSYEGLHIFSYKALFPNCSHFLPLFLNSSYEALIYILLVSLVKGGGGGGGGSALIFVRTQF